jgi:hypothetical protein
MDLAALSAAQEAYRDVTCNTRGLVPTTIANKEILFAADPDAFFFFAPRSAVTNVNLADVWPHFTLLVRSRRDHDICHAGLFNHGGCLPMQLMSFITIPDFP